MSELVHLTGGHCWVAGCDLRSVLERDDDPLGSGDITHKERRRDDALTENPEPQEQRNDDELDTVAGGFAGSGGKGGGPGDGSGDG